jgi:hypothetical protein
VYCSTCGKQMNEHFLIDDKLKCQLPEDADISHLSEFQRLAHEHYWQWVKTLGKDN